MPCCAVGSSFDPVIFPGKKGFFPYSRRHDLSVLFAMLAFAAAILVPSSFAQQPGAIPQFSTVETHEYDSINLATLGIQLNVPIRSKAGHIAYSYRLNGASQISMASHGWWVVSPWFVAGESHIARKAGYNTVTNGHGIPTTVTYSSFYVTDSEGNNHPFNISITFVTGIPNYSNYGGYALDNSGLYLNVNANNGSLIYTLTDMSGNTQTVGSSGEFSSMTDSNGNSISAGTDTLGQAGITATGISNGIPNSSTATFTWTDALGNNRTTTLTQSSYTEYTAFGCSADLTAGSAYFPTSISLPDGSSMSFTWETSALNSSDYTGRIASITVPSDTSGYQTVTYAYSGGTNGINCGDGTPATLTRTTPDGTWTYTHVPPSGGLGYTTTTTVTDPVGNSTVYTFEMGNGSLGGAGEQPFEIERQLYNSSSTLMETVLTCYNNTSSSPSSCNTTYPSDLITEKDVYTTYPGVTGYAAVKTAYDTHGRATDVKSYDFNATTQTNEKIMQYGSGSISYAFGQPHSFRLVSAVLK